MSFPYPQDGRRRPIGAGARFNATGRRDFMGYWMPLALTVGVATIGIAAWIWSERSDEDDDDEFYPYPRDGYDSGDEPLPPPPPPGYLPPRDYSPGPRSLPTDPVEPGAEYAASTETGFRDLPSQTDDSGMFSRMQGALRRTPSPQEIFGGASKRVAAGMAAAGAFVGLAPIREEGRGDFEDHTRWSEEAESRDNESNRQAAISPLMSGGLQTKAISPSQSPLNRRTVVIVVSSVSGQSDSDESEHDVRIVFFFFFF